MGKLNTILFIAAVALFFVGRWTAPKPIDTHQGVIDSLDRHMKMTDIALQQALQRQSFYIGKANEAWDRGYNEGLKKRITHVQFVKDTTRIISMLQSERDSLIRAAFLH